LVPTRRNLIRALEQRKVLLASDPVLPSVVALVAGAPIRGSWWGHPRSHAIFAALTALRHHPDALAIPFVAAKLTFIHRELWPAVLTIGLARERWQTQGLSTPARRLLERVRKSGELEASGDAVREIERRLLACSQEIHTDRGSHAKRVESWERWAARMDVSPLADVAEAKRVFERAVIDLGGNGAQRALPWCRRKRGE
jgi:hypothetical protein